MVEGELISYSEYKKRVVLETKGLQLNEAGEICANGVSLKLTLPPAAYDMFLKGLETEIASTVVEVPHSANAVARPDLAQKSLSEKYGGQIRGLIYDVLKNPYLIKDGGNGKSLISAKLPILTQAIERAKESGNNVSFKNNSQLIHSAVFGYIKDKTGKSFAEHSEVEYLSVKNLVRQYLGKLQLELHRNRKN